MPRAQNFSKMAAQFQGLQFYQVKVQSSMGQQQMMIMMKAQQVRERGEGIEHHKNRLRFPYESTFLRSDYLPLAPVVDVGGMGGQVGNTKETMAEKMEVMEIFNKQLHSSFNAEQAKLFLAFRSKVAAPPPIYTAACALGCSCACSPQHW
eukprot:SAG25_NODE_1004_length_4345_cov_2.492463_2_plen_150_part_00